MKILEKRIGLLVCLVVALVGVWGILLPTDVRALAPQSHLRDVEQALSALADQAQQAQKESLPMVFAEPNARGPFFGKVFDSVREVLVDFRPKQAGIWDDPQTGTPLLLAFLEKYPNAKFVVLARRPELYGTIEINPAFKDRVRFLPEASGEQEFLMRVQTLKAEDGLINISETDYPLHYPILGKGIHYLFLETKEHRGDLGFMSWYDNAGKEHSGALDDSHTRHAVGPQEQTAAMLLDLGLEPIRYVSLQTGHVEAILEMLNVEQRQENIDRLARAVGIALERQPSELLMPVVLALRNAKNPAMRDVLCAQFDLALRNVRCSKLYVNNHTSGPLQRILPALKSMGDFKSMARIVATLGASYHCLDSGVVARAMYEDFIDTLDGERDWTVKALLMAEIAHMLMRGPYDPSRFLQHADIAAMTDAMDQCQDDRTKAIVAQCMGHILDHWKGRIRFQIGARNFTVFLNNYRATQSDDVKVSVLNFLALAMEHDRKLAMTPEGIALFFVELGPKTSDSVKTASMVLIAMSLHHNSNLVLTEQQLIQILSMEDTLRSGLDITQAVQLALTASLINDPQAMGTIFRLMSEAKVHGKEGVILGALGEALHKHRDARFREDQINAFLDMFTHVINIAANNEP